MDQQQAEADLAELNRIFAALQANGHPFDVIGYIAADEPEDSLSDTESEIISDSDTSEFGEQ